MSLELALTQSWDRTPLEAREASTALRATLAEEFLEIEVDAPFWGDPPPASPAGPTEGLWSYEVVELFIGGEGEYFELELGPHGHHLLLRFRQIRESFERGRPIEYHTEIRGNRWVGLARVPLEALPAPPHAFNLAAIHGVGERRYLSAVTLDGDRPNFHQPQHFWPATLE